MPKLNGLDVAARISADFPATRAIILSMHLDEEYVRKAIAAGDSGYLLKDSGIAELETAIRAVAAGETYLSPAVSKHLIARYQRHERGELAAADPLTPRQLRGVALVAQGLTTKAIARDLNISVKTVETHRTQLMDRLDIHDIAGLVRYAIRIGLIEMDAGPGRSRPAPEPDGRPRPRPPRGEPRWLDAGTRESPDAPSGDPSRDEPTAPGL